MRRSLFILLALLLSALFSACRMEEYYPSEVEDPLPKTEGVPAGDTVSDPSAMRDSAGADTAGIDSAAADSAKPALPADTSAPVLPADTANPVPADSAKPALPADTTAPVPPADTANPVPADSAKTTLPADTSKPATPADTARPNPASDSLKAPVDTAKAPARPDTVLQPKPALPADTLRPPTSVDTVKPKPPVDTLKPTLPVDTSNPKPAAPVPVAVPPLLRADLEDGPSSCWGARGGNGYSLAACGAWSQIGSLGSKLAEGLGRGGSNALSVTFSRNEEVAGASLPVSGDTVNVRAWYNFAPGFDFGQGVKIGRISSFNEATQMNDVDIIMTVRSAGGPSQCGTTGMADLGLFFNGRPVGFDWGAITAPRTFQPGTWHSLEYQVALNTPGRSDGSVKLWVDGVLAAQKTGLNIRGGGGSSVKLNRLRIGGWYSNGANGNSSCADPAQPSTMLIDDVAVGKGFIGLD